MQTQVQMPGSYTDSRTIASWMGFVFWSNENIITSVISTAKWKSSETDGYCHVWGVAWRKIVDTRFDDWIHLTSLLRLKLITIVHTLNSFLMTNLSLYFFWFSDKSLVSSLLCWILDLDCVFRPELASCGPNIQHQVEQFIFLLFAVAMRTCFVLSWFLEIHRHWHVC
jgi:hypothetical protein